MSHSLHLAFAAVTAFVSAPALDAQTWEPISPDYTNVRGVNYIPTYPSIWNQSPMPPGFQDCATSFAIWWFYDPSGGTASDVDQQLGYLASIGVNTVRVWLSHLAWSAEELANPGQDAYAAKFADFLDRCAAHNIYVIACLWDSHGEVPVYNTQPQLSHNNLGAQYWISNPGPVLLPLMVDELEGTGDPPVAHRSAVAYLHDVLGAGQGRTELLLWDAMNEPAVVQGDPNKHTALVLETLDFIKSNYPGEQTTVGMAGWINHTNTIAASPHLDVLSLHPYVHSREGWDHHVALASGSRAGAFGKPLLANECGSPGGDLTMPYGQTIEYAAGVVWDWSPTGSNPAPVQGIGFCLMQAMMGWPNGRNPYHVGNGIFFHDGTVRAIDDAQPLVDAAAAQGIPLPAVSFTVKAEGAADYVPFESPLPHGACLDEIEDYITNSNVATATKAELETLLKLIGRLMTFNLVMPLGHGASEGLGGWAVPPVLPEILGGSAPKLPFWACLLGCAETYLKLNDLVSARTMLSVLQGEAFQYLGQLNGPNP
ncbi:MAG: hypothetical protein AAF628_07645 [Planctomycetota bacterium]